jgi:hypothetical protein
MTLTAFGTKFLLMAALTVALWFIDPGKASFAARRSERNGV